MARPATTEYASFYNNYINKTNVNSVQELIATYANTLNNFFNSLPEEKADFAYAENKWTVKDLLQHIIDTERIFTYRALRFARKDTTPVAGFEENEYALNANASNRTLEELKDEFVAVRKATDIFLGSLTDEQLMQFGTANGNAISVNAIAFIIFGHILHHKNILEERYL